MILCLVLHNLWYTHCCAQSTHKLFREHIKQEFDKYLRFYLPKYYVDVPHTFLVALSNILDPREMIPSTDSYSTGRRFLPGFYTENEQVFALDRDSLSLHRSLALSFEIRVRYIVELSDFLLDPTRSGSLALNGARYAIAAIHCIRFLCQDGSIRPHTILKFHRRQIRRNRPFFWRKSLRSIIPKTWLNLEKMDLESWGWLRRHGEAFRSTYRRRYTRPIETRRCAAKIYQFALKILPRLLRKSGCSLELLAYASRRSFSIQSCEWPQEAKLKARKALTEYANSTYKRCIVTSITGKPASNFNVWGQEPSAIQQYGWHLG